jgi:glycosyltransferase involved in cell wall biosynthesis
MIEAMACGTPVVACPAGAAPEIVADGVTGFLRETIDELVDAVEMVGSCSASACRARVEEEFSADHMVTEYERLLARVTR